MRRTLVLSQLLLFCAAALGQSQIQAGHAAATASEHRAVRAFDAARKNPLELAAFLHRMPKGADLHMHLSGAVYAETFLKDAAEDGLCVNPKVLSFFKPAATTRSLPPQPVCGEGNVRAADAFRDQRLYDQLVDSFSMRSFVPSAGVSGHDQFFATFGRFGGISASHTGEWLDEVATRAAAQNEQYLEVMYTPTFSEATRLGESIGWPSTQVDPQANPTGDATGTTRDDLARLRDKLLVGGLPDEVAADRKEIGDALASRDRIERCGTAAAAAGCSVKIRFLGQVLRAFPPEQVFAQTLLYFELAASDPDVVGINFVQPEDAYLAMAEYHRQMRMLDYLHGVYPKVHISLHAGELAPGLVLPAGLRFHIREAVELGHAERIGHGVDVMYEDDPHGLLKEMAARRVMVEVNLTSNAVILGVDARHHPLPLYRAAGVPVALSTDDEGVSRITLTHEYVRAAEDFGLGYLDLKGMARTSLEHSFLPGASLWAREDEFSRVAPACSGVVPGATPSGRCGEFLRSSEKAAAEWELERRFGVFEAGLP